MSETPADLELMLLEQQAICTSSLFSRKRQMVRLLSYLVTHANDADESWFDQKTIAIECLGRSADFVPADDPAVRIEVGRLRKLVDQYYENTGDTDTRLYIPKGVYRPVLVSRSGGVAPALLTVPVLQEAQVSPENLTLLLSFSSDLNNENSHVRFIRHQLRIDLSSRMAAVPSLRLVISAGKHAGQAGTRHDFRVNFHLTRDDTGTCSVNTDVHAGGVNGVIYQRADCVEQRDAEQRIAELISHYMADLFDHETGKLWQFWLDARAAESNMSPSLTARVAYQRYLLKDTAQYFTPAFDALKQAVTAEPDSEVFNLLMADGYMRAAAHDYGLAETATGLNHILSAMRMSPGNPRLHCTHALLSFFNQRYEICSVEAAAEDVKRELQSRPTPQCALLYSLMGHWQQSLVVFDRHFLRPDELPRLYKVGFYLAAMQSSSPEIVDSFKSVMSEAENQRTLAKCLQAMADYKDPDKSDFVIQQRITNHLGLSLASVH